MVRSVLILAIVVALGSAFLGWRTKEQAEALQGDLKSTKNTLGTTQSKLSKTEKDLTETKGTLEQTQATLTQTTTDLTNARGELATVKTDYEKAKADVEEKTQKLAQITAELDKVKGTFENVDPAQIAVKIKEMSEANTRLTTELAEAKQVQETLSNRAQELEGQVTAKENVIQSYKQNITRAGLTGKVLAYNPGWNFVVMNIGDKSGLKPGAQMVVTRAGAMVGKVKVTTVEPNQSIGDVLPGTLARGESVQPGDTVVFEGRR
jgi:flagellar motility protein MotE (MotC chaperone)